MSAFIIDNDTTLSHIYSGIKNSYRVNVCEKRGVQAVFTGDILGKYAQTPWGTKTWDHNYDPTDEDFKNAMLKFMRMNYSAVNQRYNEQSSCVNRVHPQYVHVSRAQFLKSLHCLIYQCTEGNVPKTKLYKSLVKLADAVANEIARNTVEYSEAQWG